MTSVIGNGGVDWGINIIRTGNISTADDDSVGMAQNKLDGYSSHLNR